MSDIDSIGTLPVQDRDLLARLSHYFDTIEERLRAGQGWFIFGRAGGRAGRISRFILNRLADYQPLISYYYVPWRDFALNAYMQEVELAAKPQEERPDSSADEKVRHEYAIATRVSRDTYYVMAGTDVLIINGLAPAHFHEVHFLDKVVEGRFRRRYPTILLTPQPLQDLAAGFQAVDPANHYWQRLFSLMYDTSLIAV